MIQDIQPSVFSNTYAQPVPAEKDKLFYFEGNGNSRRVAVFQDDNGIHCPSAHDAHDRGRQLQFLFSSSTKMN